MGQWSEYYEDFPHEAPANQPRDVEGDTLRARVARQAKYPPELIAQIQQETRRREDCAGARSEEAALPGTS
jgi:hypothetical protein